MKYKIVSILGARPQFIKAAPVSRVLKTHTAIEEVLVHTGQHYDPMMSDIFFTELQVPKPAYELDISGGNHGVMTGRMLASIEEVLLTEKPTMVLVYGDTNSTLAGSLAAAKLKIPVAHIEAGLRSFNRNMPEEVNRVLSDHMSQLLFCPTTNAVKNLAQEGIAKGVYYVGDTMYDAVLYALEYLQQNGMILDKFNFLNKPFALLTIHRAHATESIANLQKLLAYANTFALQHNIRIIFPIHPRTKKLVVELESSYPAIVYIDPLSYFETQALLSKAKFILTDSGGLQKEAYFHRILCITLREETEWVETVQNGWNRLWTAENFVSPQKEITEYGGGDAAKKIVKFIENHLY